MSAILSSAGGIESMHLGRLRLEPLEGIACAGVIDQDAAHRLGGGL
jgi:hypothetical protein